MRTGLLFCRAAAACVALALFGPGAMRAQAPAKQPAIALIDPADAAEWQGWAKQAGWQVITVDAGQQNVDLRVQALAEAARKAIEGGSADPARIYLAGRGAAVPLVFYAASRMPDAWTAAIAVGGDAQTALDTNRIFAANFEDCPILWIGLADENAETAAFMKKSGMNLEYRRAAEASMNDVFKWLAAHSRDPYPIAIDCETNSPAFARCYWIQITKLDAGARNDVLPVSLVRGNSGATLEGGSFTYRLDEPGPGVTVVSLPAKYSGKLKAGDRITALDGKPVADARAFRDTVNAITRERGAVLMIERGKERVRIETRWVLPVREPFASARVQAKYIPSDKEIQIISRSVTEMRVDVPAHWLPANMNWNGLAVQDLNTPGCLALKMEKELLHAEKCP